MSVRTVPLADPVVVASAPPRHRVAVLAYPGMSAFETGIVTEVFGLPRPELEVDWYDLVICAPDERPGTGWTSSPPPTR
jgi:hypothetical protein